MQKITPFLWFNNQAEEAVNFYLSIFENSKITSVTRYTKEWPMPEWTVMTIAFTLDWEEFVALNGWPTFSFSQAISFVISCETQKEIDDFWGNRSNGWEKQNCWWLKDKYGVSWQIVPREMNEMMNTADRNTLDRLTQVFLQMKKLDIAGLKRAYQTV